MKTTTKAGIILAAILVAGIAMAVFPSSFEGTVKINGNYAPLNLNIIACIGETPSSGPIQTTAGSGGKTVYGIDVVNGTENESVTFRIDGLLANEVGTYIPNYGGQIQSLNLTVNQSAYTLVLSEGWNLISIPVELKYDGCIEVL